MMMVNNKLGHGIPDVHEPETEWMEGNAIIEKLSEMALICSDM